MSDSSRTRCAKENHSQEIIKSSHLYFKIEHDENHTRKLLENVAALTNLWAVTFVCLFTNSTLKLT